MADFSGLFGVHNSYFEYRVNQTIAAKTIPIAQIRKKIMAAPRSGSSSFTGASTAAG